MFLEGVLAEREGFEPPIPLRVCLISSQVHSTGLCHLSASVLLIEFSIIGLLISGGPGPWRRYGMNIKSTPRSLCFRPEYRQDGSFVHPDQSLVRMRLNPVLSWGRSGLAIDLSINNAMIRVKKYEGLSDECSRGVMAAIGQRS